MKNRLSLGATALSRIAGIFMVVLILLIAGALLVCPGEWLGGSTLLGANNPAPAFMPPHPDLLERVSRGEITLPDFVTNPDLRRQMGIDQPLGTAPTENWNALALLVQFTDNPSQVGAAYFDSLLFGDGSGTLNDYYSVVSYGTLDIVTVNLPSSIGWNTMPQTYAYYVNGDYGTGTYPQNAQRLAEDAVLTADPVVDFSQYDNDGNGWVDTVFVIHAGPGAEFTGSVNDIWSHSWSTLNDPVVDGVTVNSYTTEPEFWSSPGDMTMGVFAHELGHVFGLPDLYDTDYSSYGVGDWSLMASGSWNGPYPGGSSPAFPDAWSRADLGFVTPTVVVTNVVGANIPAAETSQTVYRLWTGGSISSEYFLVENRQQTGYDTYLPSAGLLIWHVDENNSGNTAECDQLNNWLCSSYHYIVALEQADGLWDLEHKADQGDTGDSYPGSTNNRSFTFASVPNSSSYYSSSDTYVGVTNIGDSGSVMTADLSVEVSGDEYEPDDTWEQANWIYDGSPQTHSIVPVGDEDWVKFELSAESEVVIETSGPSGDTRMWLYDSSLNEIEYNDDGGSGFFSRIDRICGADPLPAGTYYVRIDEFGDNDEIASYDIAFTIIQTCVNVGPVVYDSHSVDDDNVGESSGNGDGIVNPGETIELYVDLHSQGSDAATGVTACISTTDSYVTFPDNTCSDYPDIPGGGTGTNTDDFDFELDPSAPHGHVIPFDLDITAFNGGPWSDSFDVPVMGGQALWTFLVYLDGDNNLEDAAIGDFLEMSSVGSTGDVNIVVQFDRISAYDSTYGDWTSTKRFLITTGMTPDPGNALDDIGEANMGDPQTLIDFVQWGMNNYPADRYAVIVWDHGSGWRLRPEETPLLKDVAFDDTSGGDAIDMPELRSAMNTLSDDGADPLDLMGFDACLMAMIEVDDQLIPYADVRVGSEETEPWDGWPYDTVLSALTTTPTMSAAQLGTVIVDDYHASYGNDQTQSAVDLHTPYADLNTAVNDFAVALINGVSSHYADMVTARSNSQEFHYPTYIDLYDFAYQINQYVSDATINAAATDVMNAVNNAIIREQHGSSWPGAHGISIYFPQSASDYDSNYDGSSGWLQFTANTQWDEWLHAFYQGPVQCNDPHEPNDTSGEATPISYDTTLTDPDICPAGDVDYYSFAGSAGDNIIADIDAWNIGSSLDSYLYLYDTDGATVLIHNDDYGGSLDSYIEYTLPADGTYYLMVREYGHPNEGGPSYFYTISLTTGINVGPLVYDSHTVDDDNSGQSSGNGDGIVNCGEAIELYIDLYNQGTDTATGVSACISTTDPYVTWPNNTCSDYPDISGVGTSANTDDFDFEVDPSTPDGHVIHFDLDITGSNGGPWSDSLDVPVVCEQWQAFLPLVTKDFSGYAPVWTNIMTEYFEGVFPSGDWSVADQDGVTNGEYYWDEDDFRPYRGSCSAWPANGGADGLDPQYYDYPVSLRSWMAYGPFSLTDALDAELRFYYWNQSELGYDYLFWGASVDGSMFYGTAVDGDSGGWQFTNFDLTDVYTLGDLTGEAQVWIAFLFNSDYSITDKGAFVDNIVLRKQILGPGAPAGLAEETRSPEPPSTLGVDTEVAISIHDEMERPEKTPIPTATPTEALMPTPEPYPTPEEADT